MPRPGPRPYECVRRSWHSDRHQPLRGSIIQQIFRCVNENHSSSTKKNREWQRKLPLVVFKSEEIMYSKANSEAEYLDPETLWDRANDAINTIIRKDETMETGEFLPPCVEAALNLGCVPVRTSRSQRNSNTRTYLTQQDQDPAPKNTPNINHDRPNVVKQTHTPETNRDIRQNCQITPPGPSFYPQPIQNFPQQTVPVDGKSSVYPLYYGVHFQPQNPRAFHTQTTEQNSNMIIVGRPVFQTVHEPMNFSENPFSFNNLKKIVDEEPPKPPVECDLSLRLGLVSSQREGLTRVNEVDSGQHKEFSFFPLNSEGEQVVGDVRKRKLVNNNVVDLEHDFNQKRRGL